MTNLSDRELVKYFNIANKKQARIIRAIVKKFDMQDDTYCFVGTIKNEKDAREIRCSTILDGNLFQFIFTLTEIRDAVTISPRNFLSIEYTRQIFEKVKPISINFNLKNISQAFHSIEKTKGKWNKLGKDYLSSMAGYVRYDKDRIYIYMKLLNPDAEIRIYCDNPDLPAWLRTCYSYQKLANQTYQKVLETLKKIQETA